MTTTDMTPPSVPPAASAPVRRLRRSRSDRIGAGVSGGLGTYFGVDPVLFRVLFATAAFFGGAGLLAYLLAWAVIPEEGTERGAIDSWVSELRRRRIPFWLVAVLGAVVLWLVAFSWWAPGPFFPVIAVVIILVVVLSRSHRSDPVDAPQPASVNLSKEQGTATPPPAWLGETRQWLTDSRNARRERLRRSLPFRIATVSTWLVAMVTLGLIDGLHGIPLPTYLWFTLGIVGGGFLIGLMLRRTPWGVAWLLLPTVVGLIGLAGTHVSLRDGVGQEQWKPTLAPARDYRLAFGQGVLDLRSLPAQTTPRQVRVDVAAGQVQILAPRTMNLTVRTHLHFGNLVVDGREFDEDGLRAHGVNVTRTIEPPAQAAGTPITVVVHLADGNVTLRHF
jgi:phage shock protein PspC (stress-responsive transcriptional regulator)